MASELISFGVYNTNGFNVIGSNIEGEFQINNIMTMKKKQKEERERKEKMKNQKPINFMSVPTTSTRQMMRGEAFHQSEKNANIVLPRMAITPTNTLNGFDYHIAVNTATTNDYGSSNTSFPNIFISDSGTSDILKGINITINNTNINALSSLTAVSDHVYLDTTDYTRGGDVTLLPMDVISLSNDKVDIGIFVVEVFSAQTTTSNFKRESGCEITVPGNPDNIVLGGNYDADEDETIPDIGEILSMAKDTNGNVYAIRQGCYFGKVRTFLTDGILEPTNTSTYSGVNDVPNYGNGKHEIVLERPEESDLYRLERHTVNLPTNDGNTYISSFECYVKGLLTFNTDDATTPENHHVTTIWLDVPTLISVTKTESSETYIVNIGEIITSGTTAAANGSLAIKTVPFDPTSTAYLPTESTFYQNNFTTALELNNCTLRISSLKKYYS